MTAEIEKLQRVYKWHALKSEFLLEITRPDSFLFAVFMSDPWLKF